ncbi:MAG TPA: hypothetical protein VF813_04115, partial [Anaerolineaceae bacterium]
MRERFRKHRLAVLGLIAALAWSPASPGTAAQAAVLPPRASAAEGHAVSPPLRSQPSEHPVPGEKPRTMRRPGSPLLTAQPGAGSPAAQVDPVL